MDLIIKKASKGMLRVMLLILTIGITSISFAQDNLGVGVRLGDPSGITIKKYTGDNAIELSIGRTHWSYNNGWYNNRFDHWYNEQNFGYKEFQFRGYKATTPIAIQLHYLIQNSFKNADQKNLGGLKWYYGFGGQVAIQKYDYDYRYKLHGDPNWYYETEGSSVDLDLGADGVLGLEYRFNEVPLSVFVDATLFIEIFDDPFIFHTQGGLGCRYNF